MQVKTMLLSKLTLDPANVRTHSEKNLRAIKGSLKRFGQQKPIVIDKDGVIIAGNGTFEAARDLGWERLEVVATGLDKTLAQAFAIADNRTGELADWDKDGLGKILQALREDGFDIGDIGFELDDLDELGIDTAKDGLIPDDEIPEVKESFVKRGEIWQLGEHRLMCGDSTSKDDVEKLMAGQKADLTFTSPPYNANTKFTNVKNSGKLYNDYEDNLEEKDYVEFASKVLGICLENTAGFVFWNVNYNSNTRSSFLKQIYPYLDFLSETIAWKKTALPVPYGLTRTWEPVFVFSTLDKSKRLGERNVTNFNFWEIGNNNVLNESHRAAFPVEIVEKGMSLYKEAKSVLDVFLGSGTTLIACEKTGRKCYGMEIDPHYCSVIIERWQQFSGLKASKL